VAVRLLLVEDDERIRSSLRMALEDDGYEVYEADSGESALTQFADAAVDIVVLDLMLPGMDGFECCRQLRRSSDVPIIIVSARDDTSDVVAGLEAGADDYVTKPFAVKELAARLRALRRRDRGGSGANDAVRVHRFGTLEIRPQEGLVARDGAVVHLTKTEFRLLCELAANSPRVLSRETLLERVWDYDYFADGRIVDVHVARLRRKVETDPSAPRHIVTVRGLGYKLQD
jgi:DNA-binding response OmpR family regulator